MKILKNFRNNVLKRQEIRVLVEDEKNPGFDGMRKQIAEEFKKPEKNIDVYNIKGSFGSHEFKVDAYVYDSRQDLEKFIKKKKKKGEKETIKEEAKGKKEEKTEEVKEKKGAPVEEKAEQVQEKPKSKPTEAPVEERPEEEAKAVEEQKQAEEEAKEP